MTSSVFACGCLDAPMADVGAMSIKTNFSTADKSLSSTLEKLLGEITHTYTLETYDFTEMKKALQMLLDEAMSVKEDLYFSGNQLQLR